MSEPLFLVRLVLDRRALLRVGARHRLGHAVDDGSLLHAGLAELFARSSEPATVPLHTFAVDDLRGASLGQPDRLFLLAYSCLTREALIESMGPARDSLLSRCEVREIPSFTQEQRLGFRTRVCPVARTRRVGARELALTPSGRRRHREMDAFVHATLDSTSAPAITREEVYVQWLRQQLQRQGASKLESARLTEFRREAMRRRGPARIERPNTVLEGTLTVDDPTAFRGLLIRGLGRHRAFGFGMLLLRPAEV